MNYKLSYLFARKRLGSKQIKCDAQVNKKQDDRNEQNEVPMLNELDTEHLVDESTDHDRRDDSLGVDVADLDPGRVRSDYQHGPVGPGQQLHHGVANVLDWHHAQRVHRLFDPGLGVGALNTGHDVRVGPGGAQALHVDMMFVLPAGCQAACQLDDGVLRHEVTGHVPALAAGQTRHRPDVDNLAAGPAFHPLQRHLGRGHHRHDVHLHTFSPAKVGIDAGIVDEDVDRRAEELFGRVEQRLQLRVICDVTQL